MTGGVGEHGLPRRIVVVGAGQAGVQCATTLRRLKYDGELVLISGEPHAPYQRPPLSKAFLGTLDSALIDFHDAAYYADHDIRLRLGDGAVAIERADRQVVLESGTALRYEHLVLATGSRPRGLAMFDGAANVVSLHDRDDAVLIRDAVSSSRSVLLVGGGFIGLELATYIAASGVDVTVLEPAPRVLAHAVPPEVADFLTSRHRARGVRVLNGEMVSRVERGADGSVDAVVTRIGRRIAADVVVIGVGSEPNTTLAAAAGIAVNDGILVDECFGTGDDRISAIGDISRFPVDGATRRLTSVQHATDSAIHLARALLGDRREFTAVPWFWSDQAGAKVQMAGLPDAAHDRTEVAEIADAEQVVVRRYLGNQLVSATTVNAPAEHLADRRALKASRAGATAGISAPSP